MKVHCEEATFKPVTIILETEAEVMFIAKLIGGASSLIASEFGVTQTSHENIYKILETLVGIENYRSNKGLIINLSKH